MEKSGGCRGAPDAAAAEALQRLTARRSSTELLREFVGRGTLATNGDGGSAEGKELRACGEVASAEKKRRRNRSPLNRERGTWASNRWAAAVQFVGRHVAR
jgi:hypothetical protein